ncbi:MAG: hypothetical protein CVU89_10440 [Firmicutes bacterium HGW-Firmicutes-14]|nr:MAG: hypothetical protein CVU89_10440 [Firmicutes bacterium HGW-Firmicutes-14]
MVIKYYPDETHVTEAMQVNDPLLMLVSYDGNEILLANIDDAFEHHILLKKLDYKDTEIDRFFRVVLNQEGADWTFVCPRGYKGISNQDKRMETFFNDGVNQISKAIRTIGYNAKIQIPQRYRRHFNMLKPT